MVIKNTGSDTEREEVTPQRQSAKGQQMLKAILKKKGRPWKPEKEDGIMGAEEKQSGKGHQKIP